MRNQTLIIVSGPPCSGKTTLANQLAQQFTLSLVTKDDIKESLFDSLGIKDRAWSKQLGLASLRLLYHFTESILISGGSLVIESNFKNDYDAEKLRTLMDRYGFQAIQIQCKTEGRVLLTRFKKRSESGERHPGHVDHLNYSEFENELLRGGYEPLNIDGAIINVDTTDFNSIDYTELFDRIRRKIQ